MDPTGLLTRRESLVTILPAFLVYALLAEASAMAPRKRGGAGRWIDGQEQIAEALASGRISGLCWSLEVESLAREIDLNELMDHINRSEVGLAGPPYGNDPQKRFVRFKGEDGQVRRLSYGAALFDFSPTNVITPHGHRHMVSAHMVVSGAVRVRNFDRLGDEDGSMIIRPTRDYVARLGQVSTMCSQRDNIHWFVPHEGPATTFDIVISGLEKGKSPYEIEAVDPVRGERRPDGSIVAPIISFGESAARYRANV